MGKTITVCIGSSCCIKGSYKVVDNLRSLIEKNKLEDKITLKGSFCMENCVNGVCVDVDGKLFSVSPEGTEEFFNENIIGG